MRRLTIAVALALAPLAAAPAAGQACTLDETITDCWRKFQGPMDLQLAAQGAEKASKEKKDLMQAATGVDAGGATLGSNTKNFLPLLALSGLLGGVTEGDSDGTLTVDLNFLLPGLPNPGGDRNSQLQVVVDTEPEVSMALQARLKTSFGETAVPALVQKIEDGLGGLADATVSLTYNWTGKKPGGGTMGRGLRQHEDQFARLADALAAGFRARYTLGNEQLVELGQFLMDQPGLIDNLNSIEFFKVKFSDIEEAARAGALSRLRGQEGARERAAIRDEIATRARDSAVAAGATDAADLDRAAEAALANAEGEIAARVEARLGARGEELEMRAASAGRDAAREAMALTQRWAAGMAVVADQHEKAFAEMGLDRFGALADNQPQLHFSAKRRLRDEVLGGDETSLEVTFERSSANLNRALAGCAPAAPNDMAANATCLDTYSSYVAANKDEIDAGNRFSFALEYGEVDRQTIRLDPSLLPGPPMDGTDFTSLTLEGSEKLIASLGWSRKLSSDFTGEVPLLLDLTARYENVSGDPARQDRFVATLTVTRKLGDIELPFGIVYANHGEFLPEVDEQLSAHLGLKFKGFGGAAKKAAAPGG